MKHLALLLFPALALAADQAEPRILRRYGADATAPIVDATLSWLRAQQRDDGSWPGDPPAATTALALLAHVVHSDLPGDGTEAGAAVERGFGFLLADLDPGTGRFRSAAADPLVQPLGALAFAEATGMTHDPRLAAAAAAALRALAAGRRPDGVWNADPLDPAPGGTGDVFATVWCVLALRASTTWRCDELPSAELQEVLKRALEALEALAGPDSPRAPAGGVWPDPAVAAAAFVLAEGGRCNSPVRVRMGEALAPVRVDLARPEKSVVPSRAWDSPPRDCFFLANADRQGAHPYVFPEWNKHMLGNLPDVRGWERSADGVRDACFTALSLMVYYAWTPSGLTWCPGAHDPPPPPQRIRLRAKAPAGVLPRHVRNDYSLDGPVHVPDECAADANAPAVTLEQLLAEPWRKRLSPDADPVAEMRKIGTLDAFADCWVLFLARGLDWGRLKNDPEQIALARARCEEVRAMFRCARPAVGVDIERGGMERSIAFNKLPRETDEEFPKPVRAVPFVFYGFAPADVADDFVVGLPGDDDRRVRVPGLGAFAMPKNAAKNTRPAEFAESEPHAESAENTETKPQPESAEGAFFLAALERAREIAARSDAECHVRALYSATRGREFKRGTQLAAQLTVPNPSADAGQPWLSKATATLFLGLVGTNKVDLADYDDEIRYGELRKKADANGIVSTGQGTQLSLRPAIRNKCLHWTDGETYAILQYPVRFEPALFADLWRETTNAVAKPPAVAPAPKHPDDLEAEGVRLLPELTERLAVAGLDKIWACWFVSRAPFHDGRAFHPYWGQRLDNSKNREWWMRMTAHATAPSDPERDLVMAELFYGRTDGRPFRREDYVLTAPDAAPTIRTWTDGDRFAVLRPCVLRDEDPVWDAIWAAATNAVAR